MQGILNIFCALVSLTGGKLFLVETDDENMVEEYGGDDKLLEETGDYDEYIKETVDVDEQIKETGGDDEQIKETGDYSINFKGMDAGW